MKGSKRELTATSTTDIKRATEMLSAMMLRYLSKEEITLEKLLGGNEPGHTLSGLESNFEFQIEEKDRPRVIRSAMIHAIDQLQEWTKTYSEQKLKK